MIAHVIKREIEWHRETVIRIWRITPLWGLLVPFVSALLILALNQTPVSPYLVKPVAEIVAPSVLFVALLLAIWLAWKNSHVYYKWQAFFALALFLRELHFAGTNSGFYIAFVVLIWWASENRDRMQPFIFDKRVNTAVTSLIWTYLVSKSFDRHYWDAFLADGAYRDLFEENLEIVGHLLFLGLVIFSAVIQFPELTPLAPDERR